MFALEATNTTHLFHREKIPAVIPTASKSQSNQNADNKSALSGSSASSDSSKSSSSGGSTPVAGTTLLAPYGNFVSNHYPSSGSADEVSVCNTTPGAVCYIKFTSGQTSTQLPSQTIGMDGSTSWSWNINNDAHLTSGEWQITAVATLNGQNKTTDDPLKLVVP